MGRTIIISEQQAKELIDKYLDSERSAVLHEAKDLNGVGGINCYLDMTYYDEDEYQEWLQENGKQDTQETKLEYLKATCSFVVQYLDSMTMHPMGGYKDMSFDEIYENFGEKMGNDIVNQCMDGRDHEFELYEYMNSDEFDLSNTAEVNRRAKEIMPIVDNPCGRFRGWILTDGTVLDAGWDHIAACKISPSQLKYREDFTLLGNVRFSNVSLEFGKYPTWEQLRQVRQFCEYHSYDSIQVDFLGHQNGRQSKTYRGLDYTELCDDLNRYYTYGQVRDDDDYGYGGLYESIEEKMLLHGTRADFDKFDPKFILSGFGEMAHGHGFYLTDSFDTAKAYARGGQVMQVEVPDGKYLDASYIKPSEAMSIARKFYTYYLNTEYGKSAYKGVEKEFWEYECSCIAKCPDGEYIYGTIANFIGDEGASRWLRSIGYLGLILPVGQNYDTGENVTCYVMFNENDMKIISKTPV